MISLTRNLLHYRYVLTVCVGEVGSGTDMCVCPYNNQSKINYIATGHFDLCLYTGIISYVRTYTHTYTHTHTHTRVQIWLFGYELADTLIVFCANEIHILSSKKKIEFLRPLEGALAKKEELPHLKLAIRNKVCHVYQLIQCSAYDTLGHFYKWVLNLAFLAWTTQNTKINTCK